MFHNAMMNKRSLVRVLAVCSGGLLALGSTSAARAQLLLDGTFDNLAPGTWPDWNVPAGHWYFSELSFCEDEPSQFQIVGTPGGNVLAQSFSTTGHPRVFNDFTHPVIGTLGKVLVIEFEICVPQAGIEGGFVWPWSIANHSALFNVAWLADGTIQTGRVPGEIGPGCGTGFRELVHSYPTGPNAWQHVRLVVDLYNHNWDMWWALRGEPLQQYANHRPFPFNQYSDVEAFAYGQTNHGAAATCINDTVSSLLDNVSAFESPDCIRLPGGCPCYANCDGSTTAPILNVLDFSCFLNRFAAGDSYANCDLSTTVPVLNVLDFSCFLNAFAAGCN